MPLPRISSILLSGLILTTLAGCSGMPQTRSESQPAAVPDTAPGPQRETPERPRASALAHRTVEPAQAEPEPSSQEAEPAPPADLWQRLRQGFSLPMTDDPRVAAQIEWYRNHPEYLQRVEQRARPYLFFITEELERRRMPTELALLPIVESAYQPFAYSPGRAAGLWQFIPSTGRMFGLKQNWWYDGRRDVVAATRAALDYLQQLADRFDGDWELALAAYNSGAGTVGKAIRRNRKKGRPTDFWSLRLPRETRDYVPRLLAIAAVVREPERYGITLEEMPNEPYFASIDTQAQLDLALAAEMAGISIDELYRLNPGFNRWATDPEGPHHINLPVTAVERFSEQLARLDPEQRLRWTRYRIRKGDSLGGIARRHGTTVAVLQQVNHLKGSRIRAGRHLLIPLSSKPADHYVLSEDERRKRLQNTSRQGTRVTHRVRRGDTLWDLSRRYGVSHKRLAAWNGISPRDTLRPGQTLVVWVQTQGGSRRAPLTAPDTRSPVNTQSSLYYRVRKGDSLSRIAQRFNTTVADLRRWNSLPGKYLQPGQKIRVYLDVAEQSL
ncbi:MAG TPA: LysM peptidoglycan-binding domain-containing protein [Sedimenticola thiotaurini]|uniref:LysM peptidoglycan-binding domain-containing protein n=1 Tax=Sedimenticola thiotaurini TaxID=1543721 RepID=A0A831WBY7_9GAMM|nr:LysM peptidoglycan-binding domain-containing protein [Sedimenticola thiotaurini]